MKKQFPHGADLPYLTWQISPTTISPTGICITSPARITENLCSHSILFWSPRNCFSFLQSLKAVTKTTTKTATRMATPSIQPASCSVLSLPAERDQRYRYEAGVHRWGLPRQINRTQTGSKYSQVINCINSYTTKTMRTFTRTIGSHYFSRLASNFPPFVLVGSLLSFRSHWIDFLLEISEWR